MKRFISLCIFYTMMLAFASCAGAQTWQDNYSYTHTFSGGGSTDYSNTLTWYLANNTNGGLTWVWPASNGTAHWPLVTDGSGNLSWELLQIAGGGTGQSSYSTGDLLYKSASATSLAKLAIGSTGDVLTVAGGVPVWAPGGSGGVTSFSAGTTGLTPNTATTGAVTLAGTLIIANGGTGQTTASAAFNALAPTTTDGDMIYRNSTSNVRLGAGSAYYPLVIDHVSGRPAWQQLRLDQAVQNVLPEANGGTNQSSYTTGDILYASATNTLSTRAIGSTGDVLTVAGGVPTWAPATAGMTNPMTTLGDVIYENATPAPARLAGSTSSTKRFLTQTGTGTISAAPAWGTIASGDVPDLGASYIKNQHTAQSSAGFNITDNANTIEAQIATTYTAGSATALKLISNNTNGGHANYGLAFDVAGGATNFDLIGSSSTWSMTNAGVLALGSALTVANGGTGAATLTGILFGNGTSAITGSHAVTLASEVTGTLPTANGGTGLSSPTANAVLLTNGSSVFQTIAPSTSGNVLTSNGTTWASTAPTASYTVAQTIEIDNIGRTSTDGLLIENTTAATSSVKTQYSPRLHLQGTAWKNATSSMPVDGIIEMHPNDAATDPLPEMVFAIRSNTNAYDSLLRLWKDNSGSNPIIYVGSDAGTGRGCQIRVPTVSSTSGGNFIIHGQDANGTNQPSGLVQIEASRPTGTQNSQGIKFIAGFAVGSGTSLATEKTVGSFTLSGTAAAAPTTKFSIGSSSTVTGILNVCQSAAANASCGTGTLASGTATINTTAVATGDLIFLTDVTGGTNIGTVSVGTITNATSFVVTSTNPLDNSSFNWLIIRPNYSNFSHEILFR